MDLTDSQVSDLANGLYIYGPCVSSTLIDARVNVFEKKGKKIPYPPITVDF